MSLIGLVLLAAGLSDVEFLPGQPFFLSAEEQQLPTDALGFKTWNLVGVWRIAAILLLWVLFPLSIIYFVISPEVRKKVLRRAVTLGLTGYALILLMRQCGRFTPGDLLNLDGIAETITNENAVLPSAFQPQTPQWLHWIANLVFIALLGYLAWVVMRWWNGRARTLAQVGAEAEEALNEIRAGVDLKDVVLRCYAEMVGVLQQNRGIKRGDAMTPREFEDELTQQGFPAPEVRQLTRLFELARYGGASLGKEEEAAALACLEAIRATGKGVS